MGFAGNKSMFCSSMQLSLAPFRRGRRFRLQPEVANRGTGVRQLPGPRARPLTWMKRSSLMSVMIAVALAGPQNTTASAQSGPPDIKTPAPVIHLSDNLDEKDGLGFCIDTVGRGFGDQLHAHSCKPRGGDVQFAYDARSSRIMSAAFAGKCATLTAPAAPGVTLGLVDCSNDSAEQVFVYDSSAMEFRPGGSQSLCLAVGAASRSAGPFMARSLLLAACATTNLWLRQWSVVDAE